MQKIGRKSIVVEVVIPNRRNPATPFVVKVQANKNHGICNIVQGSKLPQEVIDAKTQKKKTIMKFFPVRRVDKVLSTFQGCQYDSPDVFEQLEVALDNTLNGYE